MNRLHHCILTALLLSALPLQAIVQTGHVRSITRHDRQSVAIEGCVVRVRGQHNAVQSRPTGEFSITLANLQNGQPYALSSVVKSGYEVAEQSLIGRQLPASTDVPLEILLVNREQLQREKEAIAERARQNVEIYYEARVAQLQADLAEKRLDSIGYARSMQDLEAKYERFEPLLQAMSDRYARTDISRLDSLSIRINEAIEHGNLDEAERLVHQKGDLDARLAEILDQDAVLQAAQQTLDEQQRQLNERQQQNDARRADLGDDYYRLYSICLSRFQNDSAAYYIRRRAALDTLNFDYQIQAGQFIKDIIADDALAMTYFRRAYRIAQEQYGEMTMQNATACHEIAATLKLQGDLEHALTQYERALHIWEDIKGKNAPDVAETLNNMGELYRARRDYKTALTLHKRALKIRRSIYAPNSPQVTESMLNIGSVYYQQNDLKHAEEEFRQVWQAYQERQDVPVKLRAACLNNLAALRYRQGDKIAAAAYFEQAYNTYLKAYGPKHPNTLRSKRNLDIVRQQINP